MNSVSEVRRIPCLRVCTAVLLLVATNLITQAAPTADGCEIREGEQLNNVLHRYKVNAPSFYDQRLGEINAYPGVSWRDALQASALATGAWNEQASSGYFIQEGYILDRYDLPLWNTCPAPPNTFGDCGCQGIDYDLVVAVQDFGHGPGSGLTSYERNVDSGTLRRARALTSARCMEMQPNGKKKIHRNLIRIAKRQCLTPNGKQCDRWREIPWRIDTAGGTDLVSAILHEFGHVLGLDEAPSHINAMMNLNRDRYPNARDLYAYDIYCANTHLGYRALKAYSREQDATGGFNDRPWQVVSGNFNVAKFGLGVTWNPSISSIPLDRWATALDRTDNNVEWSVDFKAPWFTINLATTGSGVNGTWTGGYGAGPTIGRRTIDLNKDRFFVSGWKDQPKQFHQLSGHPVTQFLSKSPGSANPDFGGGVALIRCDDGECANPKPVYSGHPVRLRYDDGTKQTIFLWVDQNRGQPVELNNRQILISYGSKSESVLNAPAVLSDASKNPVRTAVTPGLACEKLQAGRYDCIIAYVPIKRPREIRVKRFRGQAVSGTYELVTDSKEYRVWEMKYNYEPHLRDEPSTAMSIEAWWNPRTERWYLAFVRSDWPWNDLQVWQSINGQNWTEIGFWAQGQPKGIIRGVVTGPTVGKRSRPIPNSTNEVTTINLGWIHDTNLY